MESIGLARNSNQHGENKGIRNAALLWRKVEHFRFEFRSLKFENSNPLWKISLAIIIIMIDKLVKALEELDNFREKEIRQRDRTKLQLRATEQFEMEIHTDLSR